MILRSLLYVPAHSEQFVATAHESDADGIILDLEDGVPEASKDAARDGLTESVKAVGRKGAQVFIRINSGERQRTDAEAAVRAKAHGLVVAKAMASRLSFGLPAIAMLESPAAILDARECAKQRTVMGLLVGSEDLATAIGGEPIAEVLRTPKLLVHYAAKAEGKLSFGMLRAVADYTDLAGLEAAAREARSHGFDGATCIHPTAVPILNSTFSA